MVEHKFIMRLNALSADYKAQFDEPPAIPLNWWMDACGGLRLDSLHICRAAEVVGREEECSFDKSRLVIAAADGPIEILIGEPVAGYPMVTEIITHRKIFH